MSDINSIIANPQVPNVLDQYKAWQDLAQAQQQQKLTTAQTQGAQLGNQMQQMQLARTGYLYGLAGIPTGAASGGAAPADGGVLGSAPGGAAPAPALGGATAAAGNSQSSYPGQTGAVQLGVPLPPLVAATVLTAKDPAAALKTAQETRRQAVFSAVSSAPPEAYPAVMQGLYQAGWVTPDMLQNALQHPEGRGRIIAATLTPEAYQGAQTAANGAGMRISPDTGLATGAPDVVAAKSALAGSTTTATQAAELPYVGPRAAATTNATNVANAQTGGPAAAATAAGAATGGGITRDINVRQPDGSFIVRQVPAAQVNDFLAGNPGSAPANTGSMMDPNVSVSPQVYASRVKSFENAGGSPGAKSGSSSATGDGQFIDGTWASTVAAAKPAWAQGMTPAQVLAARSDPAKAAEMSYAYAQQNAAGLAAVGAPVNTLTLGLSHNLGPGDIQKLMAAPSDTPMSKIVSADAVARNPQFAKQTAGQLMGQAAAKYGVNKVDVSQPWNAGGGATPVVAPGGVAGMGATTLSPQGNAALDVTKGQISKDQDVVTASLGSASAAQQQQANLIQMRNTGQEINTGSFGEARQGVQNYLATFAPEAAQKFISSVTLGKIDPSKAGSTQEFVKLALQAASSAEKANNPGGGLGITQVYQSAFPNLETQPSALKDMSNLFLINQQRTIDHANGQQQFQQDQQTQFGQPGGKYTPVQNFDSQFMKTNPPQLYVGAAAALNGKPYAAWSKGLTNEQQSAALRTIWRADPTAVVPGPTGGVIHNPALAGASQAPQ